MATTFGRKVSVAEFKEMHKTATLNVCNNPAKNTKFITTSVGTPVATISHKFDASKERCFTELIDEELGTATWCMCNVSMVNVSETF